MGVYPNRMIKFNRALASIPAMMSALERTAVSVTSDGRTERGPRQNWCNLGDIR